MSNVPDVYTIVLSLNILLIFFWNRKLTQTFPIKKKMTGKRDRYYTLQPQAFRLIVQIVYLSELTIICPFIFKGYDSKKTSILKNMFKTLFQWRIYAFFRIEIKGPNFSFILPEFFYRIFLMASCLLLAKFSEKQI